MEPFIEKLFKLYSRIMTIKEGNIVRLDYLSYVVAVICLLFAVIVFALNPTYPDTTMVAITVILAILGFILVGVGYSQRPKETILPPSTPQPVPVTLVAPPPKSESTPTTTPTIATLPEEPQKPQEETKLEKRAVRKRRKKA